MCIGKVEVRFTYLHSSCVDITTETSFLCLCVRFLMMYVGLSLRYSLLLHLQMTSEG